MRSVIVFSVLRILAFLVPFGVLMLFPAFQDLPWLAALFAAVIGLALSILFLRRPLDAVSTGLATRRGAARAGGADADVEDAANEAVQAPVVPAAADDAATAPSTDPRSADEAPAESGPPDQPTNAQNSSPA